LIYLTPASVAIHEKGIIPDVAVEQPDLDFGQPPCGEGRDARQGDRVADRQSRCVGHRRHRPHRMNRQQLVARIVKDTGVSKSLASKIGVDDARDHHEVAQER
jgi:hypothetical protein